MLKGISRFIENIYFKEYTSIKFLEDKLEYLGLNKMEINEFIDLYKSGGEEALALEDT